MQTTTGGRWGMAAGFHFAWFAVFAGLMTLVLVGVARPPAGATPDYLSQFNAKYGTTGSKLDNCSTCHTGPPSADSINSYATDFAGANHDFTAIETKDSDGDGVANLDEINARTFPGDPDDRP